MRKLILVSTLLTIFVFITGTITAQAYAHEKKNEIEGDAKSVYVIDFHVGKTLYEKNADEKAPIASMVKIMTLLLTFENIENGKLSLEDKTVISAHASSMGGSQMFIKEGDEYTIRDLIKGVAICSANDASVALAEVIAGTHDGFVDVMNARAVELGMLNTVFINATGLPGEGQYSTARDVTIMMRELLKHSEYYNYGGIFLEEYKHPDGRITEMVNTNKLVRRYKGCDSGKTGYTDAAAFCVSASAVRVNMRVIVTVIGSPESKTRFDTTCALFNYAFGNYKREIIVNENDIISNNIEVAGGDEESIELRAKSSIEYIVKKGDTIRYSLDFDLPDVIKAPIFAGQSVGKIIVLDDTGEKINETDLIAVCEIKSINFLQSLQKILSEWFIKRKIK
ncbi:MAG: D-alanyl-D-alanine carboxypeptidase [Christensenellaceae bacterium]|nr:D-alanyl-D-alanine carboxypeptidase [Christensenellaceae bacterium]